MAGLAVGALPATHLLGVEGTYVEFRAAAGLGELSFVGESGGFGGGFVDHVGAPCRVRYGFTMSLPVPRWRFQRVGFTSPGDAEVL